MDRHPTPDQIELYLDGELPAAESTLLSAHVTGCAACAHEVQTLKKLSSLAFSPRTVAPSEAFVTRVVAHLPAAASAARRWGWGWSLSTAVLAALTAFLLVRVPDVENPASTDTVFVADEGLAAPGDYALVPVEVM
jgi:anti-sigma factor RsiW